DDKLNNRIKSLEADPDATAPYDELRIYDDEGDNVSRVTLDSLESADDNGTAGNLNEEVNFVVDFTILIANRITRGDLEVL
ncbi:Cadherin-related hmr-1, partial [Toxocara canis]